MQKMSIQYPVPGFKFMTFWLWVSSFNHNTWAPAVSRLFLKSFEELVLSWIVLTKGDQKFPIQFKVLLETWMFKFWVLNQITRKQVQSVLDLHIRYLDVPTHHVPRCTYRLCTLMYLHITYLNVPTHQVPRCTYRQCALIYRDIRYLNLLYIDIILHIETIL